jgi:prepilin-type N-terminal cleavage/methylation domain-containing protein
MNYKKAFTLVELLIVISIISMLGSIIIATTTSVQAKGRDAKRTQQIRQIDLATRLYVETLDHAPSWDGCDVVDNPATISSSQASACIAVSTPGAVGYDNWDDFTNALTGGGFISSVPGDPCGESCTSLSGSPMGYTYAAPLAVQYYCYTSDTCTANKSSYQLYTPLEQTVALAGSSGSSEDDYVASFTNPGGTDTTPPTVPTDVVATMVNNDQDILISWSASTDEGSGVAGYEIDLDGLRELTVGTSKTIPVLGWMQGLQFCYPIVAIDVANNVSGPSIPGCVTVPVTHVLTTPTNLTYGTSPYQGYTRLSWNPVSCPEGVETCSIDYRVTRVGGNPGTTYFNPFFDVNWPAPYCWTVYAVDESNGWDSGISSQSCVSP